LPSGIDFTDVFILLAQIPKAQKDSLLISIFLGFWELNE